jgi:hypothetical protein
MKSEIKTRRRGEHEKYLNAVIEKTNINDLIYVTLAKSFGS